MLSRADIVSKLAGDICRAATEAGAVAIVTACPLCQVNLDTRQPGPEKVPILHFSELLGLALGVNRKTVNSWCKRHIINPGGILRVHNLI